MQCCIGRSFPAPTIAHRAASTCSLYHYANYVSHHISASYFKPSQLHAHFIRIHNLVTYFFFYSPILFFHIPLLLIPLFHKKNFVLTKCLVLVLRGPGVAQWLRRCATSRTVRRSIPGGVTGFFSDILPSDRTMVLGSTQPPVKLSTKNIPGGKGGRCVRLTSPP